MARGPQALKPQTGGIRAGPGPANHYHKKNSYKRAYQISVLSIFTDTSHDLQQARHQRMAWVEAWRRLIAAGCSAAPGRPR